MTSVTGVKHKYFCLLIEPCKRKKILKLNTSAIDKMLSFKLPFHPMGISVYKGPRLGICRIIEKIRLKCASEDHVVKPLVQSRFSQTRILRVLPNQILNIFKDGNFIISLSILHYSSFLLMSGLKPLIQSDWNFAKMQTKKSVPFREN